MNIIWIKRAQQQLRRIEYFLRENIQLDENTILDIIDNLDNAPKKLLQFPRIGRLIKTSGKKEIRRIMVRGYKIFYELRGDDIFILNVLHAKEDIEGLPIE